MNKAIDWLHFSFFSYFFYKKMIGQKGDALKIIIFSLERFRLVDGSAPSKPSQSGCSHSANHRDSMQMISPRKACWAPRLWFWHRDTRALKLKKLLVNFSHEHIKNFLASKKNTSFRNTQLPTPAHKTTPFDTFNKNEFNDIKNLRRVR